MPKIIASPSATNLYRTIFTDAVDKEALERPQWIQYKPQRFPNGSGYLHEDLFNDINTLVTDGGGRPFDWKNASLSNEFKIGDDSREDKLFSHYYNVLGDIASDDINYNRLTDIHKNRIIEEEAKYLAGLQRFIEQSIPENIGPEGKEEVRNKLSNYLDNKILPLMESTIKKYSANEANERAGDNWRRSFRTAFSSLVKQAGNMAAPIGDDYIEAAKELDENDFRNSIMKWTDEYDKKTETDLEQSTGIYNLPLAEAGRSYGKGLVGLAWDKPNYVLNKAGEYVIQSALSSFVPRIIAAGLAASGAGALRIFAGVTLGSGTGFLQEGGAYYDEAVEQLKKARSRAQADVVNRDNGDISQEDFIDRHGLTIGSEFETGDERRISYDQLTDNEIEAIAISQSKEYAAYATAFEIGGTLIAQWGASKTLQGLGRVKSNWIKSSKGQRSIANSINKKWFKSPYVKVPGQLALEMFSEGSTEYLQESLNMSMMEDMMPDYMRYTSLEKSDRLYEAGVGGATGGLVFGGASMALTRAEDRISRYREQKELSQAMSDKLEAAQDISTKIKESSKPFADKNDQIVTIAMMADPTMARLMPEVQELTDETADAEDYYLARVSDQSWMLDPKQVIKILKSYGAKKIMKDLGLTAEDFYAVLGTKARVQAVFGKKIGDESKEFFATSKKDMTAEDNTDYSGDQESNNTNNERTLGKAFQDLRAQHTEAEKRWKNTKNPEDKKEMDRLFKEMKKITANKDKRKARKNIASKNKGTFTKDPNSPKIVDLNPDTAHSQNQIYLPKWGEKIKFKIVGVTTAKNPMTGKNEKQYQGILTQQSQMYIPTTKKVKIFESEIANYYDIKGNLIESLAEDVEKKEGPPPGGVQIGTPSGIKKPKGKKSTYEVSTKGDKRFSALNARLSDGRTIEEHYQVDVKGYKSIEEGKGKPPKDKSIDTYAEYKALWEQWADENPELIAELAKLSEGKTLTDMFAKTKVSQARALTDILIERGLKLDKKPPVKKRKQKKYEDKSELLDPTQPTEPDDGWKVAIGWAKKKLDEIYKDLRRAAEAKPEDVYERFPRIYGNQKKSEALKQIEKEIADSKKDLALLEKDPIKYFEKQIESYERTIASEEGRQVELEKELKEMDEDASYNERKSLEDSISGTKLLIKNWKERVEDYKTILKADAQTSATKESKAAVEEKPEKPIEKMFVTELKELAKKRGIDISGLKKKADIVNHILLEVAKQSDELNASQKKIAQEAQDLLKSKQKQKETLSSNDDFDNLISSEPDTENIGESDIATTAQNMDDELTGDDAPHELADDEEEFKPFISWNRKGGLKGRDLRRAGAAFATAWEQTKQKYGVDNTFFSIWSKMVSKHLSDSPIKGVFDDWVEEFSSDPVSFPIDPDTLVKDHYGLTGVSSLEELESLPFTDDEVQNWIHAATYAGEFIRESIGADSLDPSVGNSSANNTKAMNNTFFAVMGITPTDRQQAALYEAVRKSGSFEDFIQILSSDEFIKNNSWFLMSGRKASQIIDETDSNRRVALRFWLNSNPVNKAKINRGNTSGTIRTLLGTWNQTKQTWNFVYKKKENKGFLKKNKNLDWVRTRMIEKWGLDPDSYAYISLDDLWGWVSYEDKEGVKKWGRKPFKGRKNITRPQWLRLFKSLIKADFIPVVVRGDGNNILLAKIKKEHYINAANYRTYWANEGITEDRAKEIIKMYIPEFNNPDLIDFFADGSDQRFMAANIARHEMYKRIYGKDYYNVSGRDIQNRSKIALTPALSNPNMPPKKVMVFDSKVGDGENSNVTFRMKLNDGTIKDNKLVQNIDNMWQYILDGMTMVSERVLAVDYPKYLGTKGRARRAKTVHYQRFGDGVMMNKHQEMSMWLPPWVDSAQIMDGDQVIAEFKRDEDGYLNIYDADGNYLDYLMSDDEAKVRTGEYVGYNKAFDIMGEAIGLIQFPHEQEKQRSKFYPQLMNYFPEPAMQEAVMEMFNNPDPKRFHTAKSLFRRLITISESPKELDAYLLSHSGRLLENESLSYILAAKLGAGFHSSGLENARRILKNDILEGISSFFQFGSNLDFRMDPTGSVTDNEIILPADHSIIKNIVNRMKKEKGRDITVNDINDYLERKPTEVMVTRSPIPSRFGYRVLRVKMVTEGMGDTFIVSPRVVKEVFEGDGDGDKASVLFFDKAFQKVGNMFKRRQPKKLGGNIGISLKGDKRDYNVGNIQDLVESIMAMQYGKGAISEIGSFARQIGVLSTWLEEIDIVDPEGKEIRISPRKLDDTVFDEDMGESHSVSNMVRRYMQAAVDHAKLLLLDKWDYSLNKLMNMYFKKDDGTLLEPEEIKILKQLLLNPIKKAGDLSRGNLGGREIPFSEYFEISSIYEDYIAQRHDEVHEFEDGSSVHIKGKEGANHYYDHLATFFAKELIKYNKPIDFFTFSKAKTQMAHLIAAEMLQDVMPERIIKTAMKQLGIKGKPTSADMAKINRHLHSAQISAQKLTNDISNLYKRKEVEAKEQPVDDPDEAENLFNINKWSYDPDARKIYEKWARIYDSMSDAQRMAFTTAYLTTTASAEFGYRRKNPGLMPPANRGSDTVLGPNTVSMYYEYYNEALTQADFLSKDDIKELSPMKKLYKSIFEEMGCIS